MPSKMKAWQGFKASVNLAYFRLSGRRPWARGYNEYKWAHLRGVLRDSGFDPEQLPPGYGLRLDERIIEYPWFISRLPAASGVLLDAGSVLNYEFLLTLPKLSGKKMFVSTLAPEASSFNQLGVSYVYEDLRSSCFRSEYFDWVACLSTIEHVGLDNTRLYTDDATKRESAPASHLEVVAELKRVLKPNGVLYLSMPFGRHENHGWFQIFDGPMVDRVIERFAPREVREVHFRYTEQGWMPSCRTASKDADYFDIHSAKGYAPDYAAASRAVVCLELSK